MKKMMFLFFLMLLISPVLKAQDDELDDMDFEEAPLPNESPVYFAIGAGYLGTMTFINYDEINTKLKNDFKLPEYEGSMYLSGVHGFTGIGIIPNIRLGFFGLTGVNNVSKDTDTTKYGSSLSLSYMGFTIDYGFVPFEHFAVLPGIQVGWSEMKQEIYNTRNNSDWADFKPNNDGKYFVKSIRGTYTFVQPHLYLEYAIKPYLMVRASAGYNFSFSPDWEYNSSVAMENVPDKISTSGLSVQFGIFVGLFNF